VGEVHDEALVLEGALLVSAWNPTTRYMKTIYIYVVTPCCYYVI
jgi:hypothetical protein